MIELKRNDKEEMEAVFTQLMTQFRHIKVKYDLMVREEIEIMYAKSNQSMMVSEEKMERLMLGD